MIKENRNNRGLLINITGNGKGKTTSGLGACVRALGWGWKVSVIQFIKDTRETGEQQFAEILSSHANFEMCQTGYGLTWKGRATKSDHIDAARKAWIKAKRYISDAKSDLLVLDELNIALGFGWLEQDEVMETLLQRPDTINVMITGRYAPEWLIEICDLVSEVKEVKHPYKSGVTAKKGIEF